MRAMIYTLTALGLVACTGDKSGSTPFEGDLLGILVVPGEVVVPRGGSVQLEAMGLLEDRETVDLTSSVSWVTDDESVAFVSDGLDEEGELQALSVGSVELRAVYEGIESPSVTAYVTDAELQRLSVSPSQVTLAEGESTQLSASALFSDGTSGDVTNQVRWITSDGSVGQLSDGMLEAISEGSAQVHVEWESSSSDAIPVTVVAPSSSAAPDLRVSAVSGSVSGGVLDLSVTIENQGEQSASLFWLDVFVNPSSTPSAGDLGTDFVWVSYLAPSDTETYDFQLDVDGTSASVYIFVDTGDAIDEVDESNNSFSGSVSESSGGGATSGPDLHISYFDYVTDGEEIYYYVDVTNSGDEAADWFYVDLYLDETSSPSLYQDGDGYHYISELSAGETTYADFLVEESCVYCWSWVQVDGYDTVLESDEDNNVEGYIIVESD